MTMESFQERLDRDKEYRYVWIPETDSRALLNALYKGAEVVEGEKEIEQVFGSKQAAKVVMNAKRQVRDASGNLLLRYPRAAWEALKQKNLEAAAEQKRMSIDAYMERLDRLRGVRPVVETREEYEDKKEFAEREGRPKVSVSSPASE